MEEAKWYYILEELLQCSVCLEIPKTLIVQCIIGHHICTFCRKTLNICPMCKQEFVQTRNFVAEDLVIKLNDIKLSIEQEIETVKQTFDKTKNTKI
ncbi:PREDICTED: E3 ubiquitin-protein ligase sina-like [Dufourea novaeangliae]|uniref:E3 ubiquitin-protein ligase sina-like n=1 Tax=Dufourea novaeangliae TaxID=178035 RepID=UPI000767433F|nr:PREDICTED: E3 ubiquitin-protein ligase sina-like [Dufourea novaeangliae]